MEIYLLILTYLICLSAIKRYSIKIFEKHFSSSELYVFLSFLMLFFIMGFRAPEIGTDTSVYYNMYINIINSTSLADAINVSKINAPIYVAYAYMLGKIFTNPQIITICNSLVICIFISRFILKSSSNVVYSTWLYFLLAIFFECFNGARQYMAVAIALNSFLYFANDNISSKRGWTLFFVALGIHNTTIIFLFAIFGIYLVKKYRKINKIIIYSTLASTISLVSVYILIDLVLYIFPYYAMYVNGSNSASILNSSGSGRIILLYIFFTLNFLVCYMKKEKIPERLKMYIPSILFLNIFGIVFANNVLINRLLWFYSAFMISFIPNSIKLYNKNQRIIIYVCIFLVLFIYCFMNLYEDKSGIIPYKFYF